MVSGMIGDAIGWGAVALFTAGSGYWSYMNRLRVHEELKELKEKERIAWLEMGLAQRKHATRDTPLSVVVDEAIERALDKFNQLPKSS